MNRKERRADKKQAQREGRRPAQAGDAVFAAAVELHQAGRLAEAQALYRQVLAVNPRHADSLHLLGAIAHQIGDQAAAADLIGQAVALAPDAALYACNLGNVLRALGRPDAALAEYRRAVELKPDYAEAHNNLAAMLLQMGRASEALDQIRLALAHKPDFAEAHDNLGNILAALGRSDEALEAYGAALALRPDLAQAHNNLGSALQARGETEAAAAAFRRATAFRPDFAEAHNNLATALKAQGRLDLAAAACRKALALRPDFVEALDNLGAVLGDQGRLEEAEAALRQALALRPDYAEAHNNLGTVLKEQGRLDAAIAAFRHAAELKPDFANAHNNLAMALLARGDFDEAWPLYEWRWATPAMAGRDRGFSQPQWRGEPAQGRRLLIHAEQGLGDAIQFCRYAALAQARELIVLLEAPAPLARLFATLAGVDQLITAGAPLPQFDLHCPLLSLPLALGTRLDTIPARPAYLAGDPDQILAWGERLAALGLSGPRIGLAWAGGAATASDARRSLAVERLAPLLTVKGAALFSLQKPAPSPMPPGLIDLMAEVRDFADTAALIANLDLVISVDTAVAHLAGALGKPVWLLDRFDPDWRWLSERRDSPWYPSLRIYRQPRPGDWDAVLAEAAADLDALVGGG